MAKKSRGKGLFVHEQPFPFSKGIWPDIDTKTDVVYGINHKLEERALNKAHANKELKKSLAKIVVEKEDTASPLNPFPGGHRNSPQIEYEFSRNAIIRTEFQAHDHAGLFWYVNRDVITGTFNFKGGKFSGIANSLMESAYFLSDDGPRPDYISIFEEPSGIPVKSLQVLDGSRGPSGSIFNASNNKYYYGLFDYERSRPYLSAEVMSHPSGKYFYEGWYDQPFLGNLI